MADHLSEKGPKGSTVIILMMFLAVIGYVAVDIWCYKNYHSWIPYDASAIVGACFVAETVSLAKLKMAKEDGRKADYSKKATNSFMSRIGVTSLQDFSDEAVAAANNGTESSQKQNQSTLVKGVTNVRPCS